MLGVNVCDAVVRNSVDFVLDVVAVSVLGVATWQMGLLNAASMAGFIFLAAPIGVWVDRISSGVLLGVNALLKAAVLVVLLCMLALQVLSFWSLVVGVAILGVLTVIVETGQTAAVPRLFPGDRVPGVVASLEATDEVVRILVPSGVALLLGYALGGWVLAACILILVAVSLMAFRLQAPGARSSSKIESSFVQEMTGALMLFRHNKSLLVVVASTAFVNAALGVLGAVEMVFLLRELGLPVLVVGIAQTAGGCGGFIGALIAGRVMARFCHSRVVVASTSVLVMAFGVILAMLFRPPVVFCALLLVVQAFVWGLGLVVRNVAVSTWFAQQVPTDMMGRVTGIRRAVTMGVVPVAGLLGGLVGGWSLAAALGVGFVLVLIAALLSSARLIG